MLKVLLIFLIFICSSFEAKANYEPIEISDEKINLSFEIYKKLKKDHFYKITNPTKLNDDFIEGLISELDENKRYFLKQEVEAFEIKNAQYDKKSFNVELAFEVINLYQQRLYEVSEFQISRPDLETIFLRATKQNWQEKDFLGRNKKRHVKETSFSN